MYREYCLSSKMQAISIAKVFMSDQLSAGVIGSGDEVSRSDSVVGKLLIINLHQSAHRTFQSPPQCEPTNCHLTAKDCCGLNITG